MLLTTYKMSKKVSYRQGLKYKPYTENPTTNQVPRRKIKEEKTHTILCYTVRLCYVTLFPYRHNMKKFLSKRQDQLLKVNKSSRNLSVNCYALMLM